ncbi:alpha/beta fold hydrolase [Marinomonas sp. M1K-6]|uniref:Alpha/beta fold hydrolase n=1 Tax=Marinomonas profundi TaxID=2726122 RepID=A0A847RAV9_9GAMM|nr:alpha/beta fold hydrolase [Marinomonas profundi]NLQ18367.1 alpha/beta fold hydrolase [Marinomonas profundi]UDV02428.1 alpha/beta fold hydrolase [Marinomonas profundi]
MIHAKQYGSSGPHLIVIHGLFGNADNWHSIAQALAEHFTVYCIDLPNHGKSDAMPDASYPKMARAVLDWTALNKIDSFYLLGHSMGGKVAMQMAAMANAKQIEKLIIVDIAPVDYQPSHTRILEGLKAIDQSQPESRKAADTQLSQYEPNLAVRQFLLKNLVKSDTGFKLALAVDNIADSYSVILKKPRIEHPVDIPTLFIKGENSDYIVAEYQEAILAAFPNARFKIISGAGHWLHAEKPLPFTSLVKRFLQ